MSEIFHILILELNLTFDYSTYFVIFSLAVSDISTSFTICFGWSDVRTHFTLFFFFLAVSDISSAVVSIPFNTSLQLHKLQFCHDIGACYWWMLGESTSTVASILNLFFIAVDRYFRNNFLLSYFIFEFYMIIE